MQRSESTLRLSAVTAAPPPPLLGKGGRPIALDFPSRFIPMAAIMTILLTLCLSVILNRMFNHQDQILRWQYISDLGSQQPEAGVMALGMVSTSVLIFSVIIINYGKVKNNLALVGATRGWKRNAFCAFSGAVGAPSLGASATFDTLRSPRLHLFFVVCFFLSSMFYIISMTNIYALLSQLEDEMETESKDLSRLQASRWITLTQSVEYKRYFSALFCVSTFLYLPVGASMVTSMSDYSKDTKLHEYRVLAQYASILSIVLFYFTIYLDCGNFQLFIVQGGLTTKRTKRG
jgi:hypothetical protein